ncbi:MAG: hypothetical protein IT233_07895 [Bacteroidia bacterium]|nr:hypothetical protein [Bacteroidia bacterium]
MLWFNQLLSDLTHDTAFSKKCAAALVEEKRYTDIKTLILACEEENEDACLVASSIIYEISQINPSLLEKEVDSFIKICVGEKDILYNNSLRILIALAPAKHKKIFKKLDVISDVILKGGDDVRDSLLELLVVLAKISPDYYKEICDALRVVLEFSPSDAFIACVEKILPVVDKNNFECFQKILMKRKNDLHISDQKKANRILSHILLRISSEN